MRAITAPEKLRELSTQLRKNDKRIGFVATMGALHDGHFALIERSKEGNDQTIVSIFVNPLQFHNSDDLQRYPRDLEADRRKLEELEVDVLFMPSVEDIYPTKPTVEISFGQMDKILEGEYRSGHFNGVAIVVCKLFSLVQPHCAYFGMKDLQQYALIKKMVADLSLPVNVVGVETHREPSGLAMSSRNLRLSQEGLATASRIYKGLQQGSDMVLAGEEMEAVKKLTMESMESDGLEVEYLEIVDPADFTLATQISGGDLAICFAGYVEGVRLIDNLFLPAQKLKLSTK